MRVGGVHANDVSRACALRRCLMVERKCTGVHERGRGGGERGGVFLSNYKRRRLGLRLLDMFGGHAVGAVGFVFSSRSLKREAGWKCRQEHESSRFGGARRPRLWVSQLRMRQGWGRRRFKGPFKKIKYAVFWY